MKSNDIFQKKALAGQAIDNCLVIDAHGHLGDCFPFPLFDSGIDSVIATMDRIGIDIFCPSAFSGFTGFARKGNDIVIDAMRRYPKRVFGYITVDINHKERIIPELERCLEAGMKAIKIHSHSLGGFTYDHANYLELYRFANEHSLPVLAHTWGRELDDLSSIYDKYPRINFILAHAGSKEKEKYAKHAREKSNVYLDLCFSGCPHGMYRYFVKENLEDKILWGSDMPFIAAEHQIGRVIFEDLTENVITKILGENALKVLINHR